jgi:hypothetical protein
MSLEETPAVPAPSAVTAFPVASASPALDDSKLAAVIKITCEVFGCTPTVESMTDPEDPNERAFCVLNVQAKGDNKQLIQQHILWGESVRPLNMDLHFRLSIHPSA